MTHLRSFGLVLAILTTQLVLSATYFCSPTGSGNGNSYSTPCSFSSGIGKLSQPGDTLYLLGGQYDLNTTQLSNLNGSSSRRIVISAYPTEQVILDFRTTAYGKRGLQIANSCTYLHIKDMTLRYSGKNNLYNEGSYCLFENLDVYGSSDTGVQMKNGGHNIIKNVDSHDNFDYQLGGVSKADFGGNADGFADKQHSGASNTYIGCRAWNNSDDGWDFFQRDNAASTTPTIIENCVCYINGPREYDMRNHPRYQTDQSWFDQFQTARNVTDADGNTVSVSLQHYKNMGNGNGFKMGGGYTTHNVTVHHCLAVANTVKGFDQNNNDGIMRIYNNTGYKNGNNMGFHNRSYGTLYIQNCISLQSRNNDMLTCQTIVQNDHNTWSSGLACQTSDFMSLDTTEILRPRLANGDLQEGNLLRLAPGSSLIDAGVNVGYTYYGTAPDLGCYESEGTIHPWLTLTSGVEEQTVIAGDSIQPIVLTWGGCDTKPNTSGKPTGIDRKVSNNNKTLTFTGAIDTEGTYVITTTTACTDDNATYTITIHVKSANLKKVAFVTTPGSAEDNVLLQYLNLQDSIVVTETDAAQAQTDYSPYDMIVLGPKPSSTAAGFTPLKGYNKPMLLLKPFLLKNTVWNWGTPVNTQDLAIKVANTQDPLFTDIDIDENDEIQLFSACNTNAVTAISAWTNMNGVVTLASPTNHEEMTSVARLTTGTDCNGVTLPQPMIMIGVSEYSTANLTQNGLMLIRNAIYELLGISHTIQTSVSAVEEQPAVHKKFTPSGIVITKDGVNYTILGQPIR